MSVTYAYSILFFIPILQGLSKARYPRMKRNDATLRRPTSLHYPVRKMSNLKPAFTVTVLLNYTIKLRLIRMGEEVGLNKEKMS